jgi:type II secretory pathway pseudopilin PulG
MAAVKARSFVMIMVSIALTALLLRFVVERLIKFSISQNEANSQATLKLIAVALDNYAADHQGVFPKDLSILIHNKPAYLDKDYLSKSPFKGYDYACNRLDNLGYSCSASPLNCGLSGKRVFTVSTGGIMVSQPCDKKE